MTRDLGQILTDVLVGHQRRQDNSGCLCGWRVLGASYAQHVAEAQILALAVEQITAPPGTAGHLPPVQVLRAPQIAADSWLQESSYATFRRGYDYASGQSRAIEGLAALTPEQTYFVWQAIDRGIKRWRGGVSR